MCLQFFVIGAFLLCMVPLRVQAQAMTPKDPLDLMCRDLNDFWSRCIDGDENPAKGTLDFSYFRDKMARWFTVLFSCGEYISEEQYVSVMDGVINDIQIWRNGDVLTLQGAEKIPYPLKQKHPHDFNDRDCGEEYEQIVRNWDQVMGRSPVPAPRQITPPKPDIHSSYAFRDQSIVSLSKGFDSDQPKGTPLLTKLAVAATVVAIVAIGVVAALPTGGGSLAITPSAATAAASLTFVLASQMNSSPQSIPNNELFQEFDQQQIWVDDQFVGVSVLPEEGGFEVTSEDGKHRCITYINSEEILCTDLDT